MLLLDTAFGFVRPYSAPLEMLLCRCHLNIATGREVRNVITQPISCDKLSELRHRVASTNFTAASGPTTGSACKVRLAASSPVPRPYRERFIDDIIKQNYYYDRLSKLNIIRWCGALPPFAWHNTAVIDGWLPRLISPRESSDRPAGNSRQ